jgi:hypothetical protein
MDGSLEKQKNFYGEMKIPWWSIPKPFVIRTNALQYIDEDV